MHVSLSYFHKLSITASPLQRSWIKSSQKCKRALSLFSGNGVVEESSSVRYFASSADGNGRNSSARYLAGIPRLLEIGRLENPKTGETYEVGQVFLHKIFPFRGVILFPWTTTVHETEHTHGDQIFSHWSIGVDPEKQKNDPIEKSDAPTKDRSANTTASVQTYYQVLVDQRDASALKSVYQDDIPTRKDDPFGFLLQALKGFAYVAHEDILPYTPSESLPIEHEHFAQFLSSQPSKGTNYTERPPLPGWRAKFQDALRESHIHKETCENIRLTVMPFFLGCAIHANSTKKKSFCWTYSLRLENLARDTVVIKDEEWTLLDSEMKKAPIHEKLLLKSLPLRLTPQSPALQVQSRILLPTRSGFIWGRLTVEREDGTKFHCRIPTLNLDSPKLNGGLGNAIVPD